MGIGELKESSRKLLLYRLCSLVQSLYPTIKTKNPFPTEQMTILTNLDLEDRLLFRELLHSLTVLNGQTSCDNDNQLTSTRSDYLNALRLILPGELQLTPRIMDTRDELLSIYGENRFTYVEACSRLKISLKTLRRSLQPLLAHGLVRKHKPKRRLLNKVCQKTKMNNLVKYGTRRKRLGCPGQGSPGKT